MFSGGANVDRPHGFKIIGTMAGGCPARSESLVLSSTNAIIGIGDLLVLQNDGTVDRAAAGATQIVGVAMEAKSASAGGTILVCTDPMVLLEAQTDGSSGGGGDALTAQTAMFLNADIVVSDATNGLSRMEIDQDEGATTATLPLKVIGLFPAIDNEFGDYNRLIVAINAHARGHDKLGI